MHECFLFRVSDSEAVFLVGVVDSEVAEPVVEPVAGDFVLVVGADGRPDDFEKEGFGAEGSGHVMSAARADLQCILIFSYKYHCLVRSNPGIAVFSGMDIRRSGIDTPGFSKLISTASVLETRCARIFPGLSDEVWKQW